MINLGDSGCDTMGPAASTPRILRFGLFELDVRSGELWKQGRRVRLEGQPVQILIRLLENPGELVTREELRQKLWPADAFGNFEQGLNAAVKRLREALNDSAENPRFVGTLPRRGYRFLAPVEVVRTADDEQQPASESVDPMDSHQVGVKDDIPSPNGGQSRTARRIYAIALLLMLGAVGVWLLRPKRNPSPLIRSLVVLPLENLSGDPSQDYFSDGVTDELITELGQIMQLRVISRSSAMTYKGVRKPLPQIAHELNVDAVLEGTVARSSQQVRITARLIQANSDKELWAQSYEGELREAFALEKQVARAVVEQIRIQLTVEERSALKSVKAVNSDAYEAYLKGRYFWNKRTTEGLKAAINYFNQSIEKDPTYAQAYAGLADSYALSGDWEYGVLAPKDAYPKAKAAARRALELDNNLGEAHISLAFALDGFDWNFEAADREFQRGLQLNPGYATGHHWYAGHLLLFRQNDQAIAEMEKAKDLDPLSLIIGADLAEDFLIAHRPDEAIQEARKAIEMDSNFALAHYQLGLAFVFVHKYNDGLEELQRAVKLSGGNTASISGLAYAYALSGRNSAAEVILKDLKSRPNASISNAPEIALVYVGLHRFDQAMDWLEKGYAERFNPGVLMRPGFDPMRSDSRFQDLLHRIGLR